MRLLLITLAMLPVAIALDWTNPDFYFGGLRDIITKSDDMEEMLLRGKLGFFKRRVKEEYEKGELTHSS